MECFLKIGKNDVTFDIYKNQIWELRLILLEKFIQAGRKVNFICLVYDTYSRNIVK